jgi:hypothetical protein
LTGELQGRRRFAIREFAAGLLSVDVEEFIVTAPRTVGTELKMSPDRSKPAGFKSSPSYRPSTVAIVRGWCVCALAPVLMATTSRRVREGRMATSPQLLALARQGLSG